MLINGHRIFSPDWQNTAPHGFKSIYKWESRCLSQPACCGNERAEDVVKAGRPLRKLKWPMLLLLFLWNIWSCMVKQFTLYNLHLWAEKHLSPALHPLPVSSQTAERWFPVRLFKTVRSLFCVDCELPIWAVTGVIDRITDTRRKNW